VAVVDTNCDPDVIDYVIPGNDDAIRSGTLLCRVISDAVIEGKHMASLRAPAPGRTAQDEERVAIEQAEARRLALLDSQRREARGAARPPPARAGAPARAAAAHAPPAHPPAAPPDPSAVGVSPEAAADTSAATAPEADTTVAGETEAPAAAA